MKILDRFRSIDDHRTMAQRKKYDQPHYEKKNSKSKSKQHDGDLVLDVNGGKVKVTVTRRQKSLGGNKAAVDYLKGEIKDELDDDDEFAQLYSRRFLGNETETVSISNDTPVHDTVGKAAKSSAGTPPPLPNKRSRSIIINPFSIFRISTAGKRKVANIDDNDDESHHHHHHNKDSFIATPEDLIITAKEIYELSTGTTTNQQQQQQQQRRRRRPIQTQNQNQKKNMDMNGEKTEGTNHDIDNPTTISRASSKGPITIDHVEKEVEYDNCKSNCVVLPTTIVDQLLVPATDIDTGNLPSLIDIFDGDDDEDNGENDDDEKGEKGVESDGIEFEIGDETICPSTVPSGTKKESMFGRFRRGLRSKSWRSGSTKRKRRQMNRSPLHNTTITVKDDKEEIEVHLDAV
mmetsp:Transcript_9280/g.23412  ORF Transcript_9280/g.23412 Transcript_9280/m.23412 type:complete len:404 (+) Transcript_9280:386-1597(+)